MATTRPEKPVRERSLATTAKRPPFKRKQHPLKVLAREVNEASLSLGFRHLAPGIYHLFLLKTFYPCSRSIWKNFLPSRTKETRHGKATTDRPLSPRQPSNLKYGNCLNTTCTICTSKQKIQIYHGTPPQKKKNSSTNCLASFYSTILPRNLKRFACSASRPTRIAKARCSLWYTSMRFRLQKARAELEFVGGCWAHWNNCVQGSRSSCLCLHASDATPMHSRSTSTSGSNSMSTRPRPRLYFSNYYDNRQKFEPFINNIQAKLLNHRYIYTRGQSPRRHPASQETKELKHRYRSNERVIRRYGHRVYMVVYQAETRENDDIETTTTVSGF